MNTLDIVVEDDYLSPSEMEEMQATVAPEPCPQCGGEGSWIIGPFDPIFGEDREHCDMCDGTGRVW